MDINNMREENRPADRLALIQKLGIEYKAEFVPFSKSRNAGNKEKSLNWKVTISRGRRSLTADYMQGIGHLPNYSSAFSRLAIYDDAVNFACESGKSAIIKHKNGYDAAQGDRHLQRLEIIPAPELQDVLSSLVADSDALDSPTFEDWASNYGYDVDSRSGEKIYRACLEIGLKLRAMLGNDNLKKLHELFQDY